MLTVGNDKTGRVNYWQPEGEGAGLVSEVGPLRGRPGQGAAPRAPGGRTAGGGPWRPTWWWSAWTCGWARSAW